MNAGTLVVADANAIQNSQALVPARGATVLFANGITNIGTGSLGTSAINGGGTIDLTNQGGGAVTLNIGSALYWGYGAQTGSFAGSVIGNGSLVKSGNGVQTFKGVNTYSGGTTVNQGTIAFQNPLAGLAESLGTLSLSGADATLQSSYGTNTSGNMSVSVSSLAARGAGNSTVYIVNGGTLTGAAPTNKIVLGGRSAGFIDQGTFYGTNSGNNFAWYDSNNYVRGIAYGSDAGSVTSGAATGVSGAYVQVTGAISAQPTDTFTTLSLSGSNSFTLDTGAVLTVNGILKSGSSAGVLGGGAGIQAANNAELTIRTDAAGDGLTISTPILANGSNALTKSGAGTLFLNAANTLTGAVSINNGALNVSATGSTGTGPMTLASWTTLTNSGLVGGSVTTNNSVTVTNNSGGTIGGTVILNGIGATVTNSAGGTLGGGAVLNGTGVTLTNNGTVSGTLTLNAANIATLNGGSVTSLVAANGTSTLNMAGSTALTIGAVSGSGSAGLNYTNTYTGGNTLNFALGNNSFNYLKNTGANGNLIVTGSGSVNAFSGSFNNQTGVPSSMTTFQSGTFTFATGYGNAGSNPSSITVDGAYVKLGGGRYYGSAGGTTTVTSGTLVIAGDRLDPGEQQTAFTSIVFNVSGGLFDSAGSTYGFSLGNATANDNGSATVNQTGGVFQHGVSAGSGGGFSIGGTTRSNYQAAYNFQGGLLRTAATIASVGAPAAGSSNSFNWTGGTLTAPGVNTTNLESFDGLHDTGTAGGTLFNGGGILAPGDLYNGTQYSGKTTITGNYNVTNVSGSAALNVNVGGTGAATGFHAIANGYDNVAVTGTVALAGALNVGLINNYTPGSGNSFTVMTYANTASPGSFSNTVAATNGGNRVFLPDGLNTFLVTTSSTNVVLSGYAANEWQGATGSDFASNTNWTVIAPGSGTTAGYSAKFGTAASGAGSVDVTAAQTLRGLIFANTHSYNLSGAGGLTLQGTGSASASIAVNSGTHSVLTPVTLGSNLTVSGSTNTELTLGDVSGASKTLTKNGSGTLSAA